MFLGVPNGRRLRLMGTVLASGFACAALLAQGWAGAQVTVTEDPIAGLDPAGGHRLVFEYTTDDPGRPGGPRWTRLPHATPGGNAESLLVFQKRVKFVESSLVAAVSAGETRLRVPPGDFARFPQAPFELGVTGSGATELVRVSAKEAPDTFVVSRGSAETAAVAHAAGEVVRMAGGVESDPAVRDDALLTVDVRGLFYQRKVTSWPANGGTPLPRVAPWDLLSNPGSGTGHVTGFGIASEWSHLGAVLPAGEATLPPISPTEPVSEQFTATPDTPVAGHPLPVTPCGGWLLGCSDDFVARFSYQQLYDTVGGDPEHPGNSRPMPRAWFRFRVEVHVMRRSGRADELLFTGGLRTSPVGDAVRRPVTLDGHVGEWDTYWPDRSDLVVYLKLRERNDWADPLNTGNPNMLVGAGARTMDCSGASCTPRPWPGLGITADVLDMSVELDYSRGDPGAVGFPGDTAAGIRLGRQGESSQWVALGHDAGVAGGVPAQARLRFRRHAATAGLPDTLDADFTVRGVPRLLAGMFRSHAGGGPGHALDTDGDSVPDAYADRDMRFGHSGDTPARLNGVYVSRTDRRSVTAPSVLVDALALSVDATLPTQLRLDTKAHFTGANTKTVLETLDARTCASAWGEAGCDPEPTGETRFRLLSNQLPPWNPLTGRYLESYDTFDPPPAELAATSAGHFALPEPAGRFVRYRSDETARTWSLAGNVASLEHVDLDRVAVPGGVRARVDASAGGPLGVQAGLVRADAGGTPVGTTAVWSALSRLPGHVAGGHSVDLTIDPVGTTGDGDPVQVEWGLGERAAAAFALEQAPGLLPAGRMRTAGWVGTGDGSADGIPSHASLSLDVDGGRGGVSWAADAATAVDAGVSTQSLADVFTGWVTNMRMAAAVPGRLGFSWHSGATGLESAVATTCDGAGACAPVPRARVVGLRSRGAVSSGALQTPFLSFSAAPADLVAGAGEHFSPASEDFLRLARWDGGWTVGGSFTGLTEARVDRSPGVLGARVRSTGGRPLGVEANLQDPGSALQVWSVLADVPADVWMAADTGRNPQSVLWSLSGPSAAAVAATLTRAQLSPVPAGRATRLSGWFGRREGGGQVAGIPTSAQLTFDLPDSGRSAVALRSSADMAVDVGVSTASLVDMVAGQVLDARVRATVPRRLDVAWTNGSSGFESAELTTCDAAGSCTPAPSVEARVGRSRGTVSPVPLARPFDAFGAAPDVLTSTQGGHFPPVSTDYVGLTTEATGWPVPVRSWTAGGRVSGLRRAVLTRTGERVDVDADVEGGRPLGIQARLREDYGNPISFPVRPARTDHRVWSVLESVPPHVGLELDLKASPARVAWDVGGPVAAAVAVELHTSAFLRCGVPSPCSGGITTVDGRDTYLAGWFGRDEGGASVEGIPGRAGVELALADVGESRVDFDANAATSIDLGVSTRAVAPLTSMTRATTNLHARARVGRHLGARWSRDAAGFESAEVLGCPTEDPCPFVEDATVVIGRDLPGVAPGYGALGRALPGFPAAPWDLDFTSAGHFEPELDAARQYVDYDVGDMGTWQLGVSLASLRAVSFHRDGRGQHVGARTGTTGGRFGVHARLAGGSALSDVRAVLADLPESVTADLDMAEDDGDPREVTWDLSSRTGAALAVGITPRSGGGQTRLAGWVGTGTGSHDGIPGWARVTFGTRDLGGGRREGAMAWLAGDDFVADVGLVTHGPEDRANTAPPTQAWGTRLRAGARIPRALNVRWVNRSEGLERATVTTCSPLSLEGLTGGLPGKGLLGGLGEVTPVCEAVSDLDVAVQRGPGLYGLAFAPLTLADPDPGDDDVFPALSAGSDDLVRARSTRLTGPSGAPTAAYLARLKLSELSSAALLRRGSTYFDETQMCVSAGLSEGDGEGFLGLGVAADTGAGTPVLWVDGGVAVTEAPAGSGRYPLEAQLRVATPVSGEIGDLTPVEAVAGRFNPLVDLVREGCPDLDAYPDADPAPGPGAVKGTPAPAELRGRVRFGTGEALRRARGTAAALRPPGGGGGLTVLSAGADTALDGDFRFPLPHWLRLDQPLMLVCGGGRQDPATCAVAESYDATTVNAVQAALRSDLDGSLGALDVAYLSAAPSGGLRRMRAHVDQLPGTLVVDGTLSRRPRDEALSAAVSVSAAEPVGGVEVEYWDPDDPARLGDPSESTDPRNEDVPNYEVRLHEVADELDLRIDLAMPGAALAGEPAYAAGDCAFEYNAQDGHVYPQGEDPRTWSARGPRSAEELRGAYVHADVDLAGARAVALQMDNRDGRLPYQIGRDDWSEVKSRAGRVKVAQVRLESDVPTTGTVRALLPGVTVAESTKGEIGNADTEFQVCMDADLPVEAAWSRATAMAFGADDMKMTATMRDTDVRAGADLDLWFRERVYRPGDADGEPGTFNGAFYHDLLTWLSPGAADWYTRVQGARKTVGVVDVAGFEDGDVPDQGDERQTHFDMGAWNHAGCHDSWDCWHRPDRWADDPETEYLTFGADLMFQKSVADGLSESGPLGKAVWKKIWGTIVDRDMRDLPDSDVTGREYRVPEVRRGQPESPFYIGTVTAPQTCGAVHGATSWESGALTRISDGSDFRLAAVYNAEGRVEWYLVGRYPNGEIRFVNKLNDWDVDRVAQDCYQFRFGLAMATTGGGVFVQHDMQVRSHTPLLGWTGWKRKGGPYYSRMDLSGNRYSLEPFPLTAYNPAGGAFRVGRPVRFSGGFAVDECVWLPGDGTKQKVPDPHPPFHDHVFLFPGLYTARHICRWGGNPALETTFYVLP